jgi:hypothetical protein
LLLAFISVPCGDSVSPGPNDVAAWYPVSASKPAMSTSTGLAVLGLTASRSAGAVLKLRMPSVWLASSLPVASASNVQVAVTLWLAGIVSHEYCGSPVTRWTPESCPSDAVAR